MAYNVYVIRPLEHGLHLENASLNSPFHYAYWPIKNFDIKQGSIQKRWGYLIDRTLDRAVYAIVLYQKSDGNRYTLYLTDTDLCFKEVAAGKTWSYKTDTYTTGTISGITGAVVTGNATAWNATTNVAPGDKFIVDSEHTADIEPDAQWHTISTVDGATQITLTADYSNPAATGTYKIRKVYSTPTNERWSCDFVGDTFYFTNGNTRVQKFVNTIAAPYAVDVDATYATKARYCIEYANRLVIADFYSGADRQSYSVQWSKEGDPTNWTDSTAGSIQLLETRDYITGLGKIAGDLIVYRADSLHIGSRTGTSTSPIIFPRQFKGVGCIAPYSIIEANSSNYFLGRDDFYKIEGGVPVNIKPTMRYKFFDLVTETEATRTYGFHNSLNSQLFWRATTSSGIFWFIYDYRLNEWMVHEYADYDMFCGGKGAV